MKSHMKKGLAFLLTLAVFSSLFTGIMSVSAMDLSKPYEVSWDHTLTDYDGNTFTWYGGISSDSNDFGHSYGNTSHTIHDYTVKRQGLTGSNSDWTYDVDYVYAFCIEPGVPLPNSNEYKGSSDPNHGNKWRRLSASQQDLLMRALTYGYPNRQGLQTSKDANACYAATQLIVWQIALGWRTSPTSINDRSYAMSGHSGTMTAQLTGNKYLKTYYDAILSDMAKHTTRPSFAAGSALSAPTYELTGAGGQWKVTLTDTNSVLSDYYVADSAGLSASISGNTLTITSSAPITAEKQIRLEKRLPSTTMTTGFLTWSVPGKEGANQDMVTGVDNDPVPAYLKLKVSTGTLNIIKTTKNNDGKAGGFQFRVTKDGAAVGTFTSGNDGRISIPDLVAGWYKVEEINLSDDFVKPAPNPVDVEVKSGQTATVNFENVRKLGIITVQKVNSRPLMGDYSLAGAEFTVKDKSGNTVDTIVTGADGKGRSKALPLGTYTVLESKAPYGFVVNKNVYTRTLSGSQGTAAVVYCPEINVPEKPQTGKITITKQDAETAERAQGDATLSGAVFDLLDNKGNRIERLYCGSAASITTQEIPLGNGYVIKEVTPPHGYTLSQTEYTVDVAYAGQNVEINLKSAEVKNTVIKGKIAVIKHSDSPDPAVNPDNPQVQEPLGDVVFRVWLKSAGSFERARDSEKDVITTNKNGWAVTKPLPFGTYLVEEIQGKPEHKICDPFEVYITENDRTYYYNVENPAYYGRVKIIKTDATTGNIIPQAGIEFRVKNTDTGVWVEQEILYPTPAVLTSYFTAADGTLVMPEALKHGNYELWEVQSPYGYLLSDKPVSFKVTSENPVPYLEVKIANEPVMGRVTVEKTGEMLTGAALLTDGDATRYMPQYEVRGLSGAVFDIIARTDIVTPDGTVRLTAGEIADTVTTGADGSAASKLLFLGDYYAVEREAPYGMALNVTEYDFSLVYENQTTPVVFAQVGAYNERQRAAVLLEKACELPDNAAEDFNPYADIVFGIFAREDILTADGTLAIPKDGLLEYITFDRDGRADIQTDLPIAAYYVRELQTGAGYILDENQYDFAFDYTGQDTASVEIAVNGGKPIENRLQRGSLRVIKTFENMKTPIARVPFTITGQTTAGTTVIMEAVTDENGEILLENLLVGDYTVQELESDLTVGYVLSPEETAVVAADEITEMTIHNILQRGGLKIIKTFEGKETPVAGVKFTVSGVSVTGIAFSGEFETDGQGEILIEGLPIGAYKVVEIGSELTEGYVLSDEQTAEVAADELCEMRIDNKRIRGDVKIIKTDKDAGRPLAGAKFGLYQDGELIAEDVTGADGVAAFLGIPYGEYEIRELAAPEGYKLTEETFTVAIRENGEAITIEAVNEKVPEPEVPDIPQTGDNSNMALWLALMGASAGALILTLRRRKKTDNAQ